MEPNFCFLCIFLAVKLNYWILGYLIIQNCQIFLKVVVPFGSSTYFQKRTMNIWNLVINAEIFRTDVVLGILYDWKWRVLESSEWVWLCLCDKHSMGVLTAMFKSYELPYPRHPSLSSIPFIFSILPQLQYSFTALPLNLWMNPQAWSISWNAFTKHKISNWKHQILSRNLKT